MTALALRTAYGVNAVSQLHGIVTREMWAPMWPGVARDDRPVRAITNGVHVPTWLSNEMARMFDDYMPADWRDRHDDPELWKLVLEIPDVPEIVQPLVSIVPLQLLAYHVARLRGCDIDKPRNLAKSVTVE